jgi:uncharacterized alpha/beta hydrolase family protein
MIGANKKKIVALFPVTALIASVILISVLPQLTAAYAQTPSTNDPKQQPLPVILIHGYFSDASVWNKWQDLLKKDGIQYYPITFSQSDDKCGSAAEHAKEL